MDLILERHEIPKDILQFFEPAECGQCYVCQMVEVCREVKRVLRPDGTFWLNIGDSYASTGGDPDRLLRDHVRPFGDVKPKDKIGIPWMVAFALRKDGWYLRSDIIWGKTAPMPESVRDRATTAHEYIFMLTKSQHYNFDGLEESAYDANIGIRNIRSVWMLGPERAPDFHFACVDEMTECLTTQGWKFNEELKIGDMAAQYNMETGKLSWGLVKDIASYKVENLNMIRVSQPSLDMLLTENHKCIIYRPNKKDGTKERMFVRADKLKAYHLIPTAAQWEQEGIRTISKEMAELLGWYIAEGHNRVYGGVYIYQSLAVNKSKVERIESLLIELNADYNRRLRADGRTIDFYIKGTIAEQLREFTKGPGNVKWIPEESLLWDPQLIESLLYGLIEGDGNTKKDGRQIFYQKNDEQCDLFQALATRLGLSTLMRKHNGGCFQVNLTKHKTRSMGGAPSSYENIYNEKYTGTVWCPNLPQGTWVARRKGTVFITGNTFVPEVPRRCILSSLGKKGVCAKCGVPWKRKIETKVLDRDKAPRPLTKTAREGQANNSVGSDTWGHKIVHKMLGWEPVCECNCDETVPGLVLDPFLGSGTTALVANQLGHDCIGVELSPSNARFAKQRIEKEAGRFFGKNVTIDFGNAVTRDGGLVVGEMHNDQPPAEAAES